MSNIYSDDVITLINTLWINQAWAAQVALALYEERLISKDTIQRQSFQDWCKYRFEEAPYDEYE